MSKKVATLKIPRRAISQLLRNIDIEARKEDPYEYGLPSDSSGKLAYEVVKWLEKHGIEVEE